MDRFSPLVAEAVGLVGLQAPLMGGAVVVPEQQEPQDLQGLHLYLLAAPVRQEAADQEGVLVTLQLAKKASRGLLAQTCFSLYMELAVMEVTAGMAVPEEHLEQREAADHLELLAKTASS